MDPLLRNATLSLDEKEEIARKLIRDALPGIKRPAIGFSGGKKSVVLLCLMRQECTLPLKVFYVRIGDEFENMTQFTIKLKKLWHLDLTVESWTDEASEADFRLCCRPPIAAALKFLVQKHAIDCLFLGNAFDDPRPINPADGIDIACVNPIFHFSDSDIRDYIKKHKIPCCSLYDEGYEKLDCKCCTLPPAAKSSEAATEEEALIKEKLRGLGYI
jgi:3'-phosphoadenosine 5'-phosphosulfate sulfotransferase (PAPS reductase)/FAD synthetase